MNHHVSTYAWALAIAAVIGGALGFCAGLRYGPSYHDALTVEYRLREVFCEQAVRNSLLKTCEVLR